MVNTVSPTYAAETRTPELGYGLAPYLNDKGPDYIGILNGVEYEQWDPATDRLIPANYWPQDMAGKVVCKSRLQERFGLEVNPAIPLFGVVSRLVGQKGLDLLARAIDDVMKNMHVQFVILGSGEKALEASFRRLAVRYPGRVGSYIGYNNEISHCIEAGADFFVTPSRYLAVRLEPDVFTEIRDTSGGACDRRAGMILSSSMTNVLGKARDLNFRMQIQPRCITPSVGQSALITTAKSIYAV